MSHYLITLKITVPSCNSGKKRKNLRRNVKQMQLCVGRSIRFSNWPWEVEEIQDFAPVGTLSPAKSSHWYFCKRY